MSVSVSAPASRRAMASRRWCASACAGGRTARRGPARVAGALLGEGHTQVLAVVLDNPHLTEAQILKVLSRGKLPASVVPALIRHRKWSISYNIRLALLRQPSAPLATILSYLPQLTVSDLRELAAPGIVPEALRRYIQAEVQRRLHSGKIPARWPPGDRSASPRDCIPDCREQNTALRRL